MIDNKGKKRKKSGGGSAYLKYSGLGFQLVAMILIALWLGNKVDTKFNFDPPYFTILFILVAFFGFMAKLVVDLSKDQNAS
jgi:uncharacterized membrane protein